MNPDQLYERILKVAVRKIIILILAEEVLKDVYKTRVSLQDKKEHSPEIMEALQGEYIENMGVVSFETDIFR